HDASERCAAHSAAGPLGDSEARVHGEVYVEVATGRSTVGAGDEVAATLRADELLHDPGIILVADRSLDELRPAGRSGEPEGSGAAKRCSVVMVGSEETAATAVFPAPLEDEAGRVLDDLLDEIAESLA